MAVATTNGGNGISGNTLECCRDLDHLLTTAQRLPDNPYDGHTLAETLTTVESVTGVSVTDA